MTEERKQIMLEALFCDERSIRRTLLMTPLEVQRRLTEQGLTYTTEEIDEVGAELASWVRLAAERAQSGELNAKTLAEITGGAQLTELINYKQLAVSFGRLEHATILW